MALALHILAWDTHFFGYPVGKIDLLSHDEIGLAMLLEKARQQGLKLVYVFTDSHTVLSQTLTDTYTGYLVDTKVTYSHALEPSEPTTTAGYISAFSPEHDVAQLYELAYQSGEYSRFNVDPAVGEENFRKLYRQWIDNSISEQGDVSTFVYAMDGAILGFITGHKSQPVATIGLLATDRSSRGRGIGRALLDYVRHDLRTTSAVRLDVATQKKNTTACRFYERNGFVSQSEVAVYHVWL